MSTIETGYSVISPSLRNSDEPDSSQESQAPDNCVYQAPEPIAFQAKSTSWQDTALKVTCIVLKVIFFWAYFPLRWFANYCLLPGALSTRFESAKEAAERRELVEATIADFTIRNLKPTRCSFKTPDNVQIDGLLFEPRDGSPFQKPKAIIYLCPNRAPYEEMHRQFIDTISYRLYGTAVLFLNYRGIGDSGGSPEIDKLPLDAYSAYEYLINEKGYAPEDIAFHGYSMGGGVGPIAAELVQQQHPDSALGGVSVCSFSSLSQVAKEFSFREPGLLKAIGSGLVRVFGSALIKALGVDLRVEESWRKLKGTKCAINNDKDPIIGRPAALASSTQGVFLGSDAHSVSLHEPLVIEAMQDAVFGPLLPPPDTSVSVS